MTLVLIWARKVKNADLGLPYLQLASFLQTSTGYTPTRCFTLIAAVPSVGAGGQILCLQENTADET